MKTSLFATAAVALFAAASTSPADYTRKDDFELRTANFSVRIRPEAAFTIGGFKYRGHPAGMPNGNYGFLIAPAPGAFIGSGHTEGGTEVVENLRLLDGGKKVEPLPLGGSLEGTSFRVEKTSALGEAVEIECTTEIGADSIKFVHLMRIKSDCKLHLAYPFMFIWPKTTTEFAAGLTNGEVITGQFDNDGWEVRNDTRWMACFEPIEGLGIVTVFAPDFPPGDPAGHRHAFWDHPAYHKQYFQFADRRPFTAGEEFRFSAELLVFEATVQDWKEKLAQTLREHGVTTPLP